jgi:hypothetical protein
MTPNSMAPRLRNPGGGEHNIPMDENPLADSMAVVITWRVLPSVCTAACAVFFLLALVVSSPAERIAWGLAAVFFAAGAIYNFRRRYELSQGHLLVRQAFTRRRIILSELTSVEAVPMTASRGRVFWHLVLEDRQGTRARLSLLHTEPGVRRHFLTALMPFAYAPGVRLEGPVDRAMAGTLW